MDKRPRPDAYDAEPPSPADFHHRGSYLPPEHRLALAVLEKALEDASRPPTKLGRYRPRTGITSARDWIASDERGGWPFLYINVCDVLGIDSDYPRRLLRQRDADRLAVARAMKEAS